MWRRTLLLSIAASAVSACGFRLRGVASVPTFALRIASGKGGVARALVKQLRQSGVAVSVDGESQPAGAADYTLVVIDDQRIRTVQATNTSGQVRELKLRVQFRWTLVDTENKEVLPPQTALYEQDLSFNETQALGKAEEEALIFETLQQRAVAAVINQLARINR